MAPPRFQPGFSSRAPPIAADAGKSGARDIGPDGLCLGEWDPEPLEATWGRKVAMIHVEAHRVNTDHLAHGLGSARSSANRAACPAAVSHLVLAHRLQSDMSGCDVIGADIVCPMPTIDHPNQLTSLTTTVLMFELICLIGDRLRAQRGG